MPYVNGSFIPPTFDELLEIVVDKWNAEFNTNYDVESFAGTNAYRFAYTFIQTQIEGQTAFAEIYAKLQDYFNVINAKLAAPKTTNIGIVRALQEKGYTASVRSNGNGTPGRLGVAVVYDAAADTDGSVKTDILQTIKDSSAAGLAYDGSVRENLTLSNGQVFEFAFQPAELKRTWLTLSITQDRGSSYAMEQTDVIKKRLLQNISKMYGLGQDFAPEKYFEINRDAPYAANIELYYSFNQFTPNTNAVYQADYTKLLTFNLDDIKVDFNE